MFAAFEPKKGILVNVVARTWPGINKPGGVGRIIDITYKEDIMCVDVKYMLGGIDKCIELEYVKDHSLDDQDNVKRGRSSRSKRLPGVSNALVDGDHIQPQPKLTKEEDADSEAPSRKKTKAKKISKKNALKDATSKANKKVQTSKQEPKKAVAKKSKKRKTPVEESIPEVSQKKQKMTKNSGGEIKVHESKKDKKVSKKKKGGNAVEKISDLHAETSKKEKQKKSRRRKKSISATTSSKISPEATADTAITTTNTASSSVAATSNPGFLKDVYHDISDKATTFVQDIVGGKVKGSKSDSESEPSSPGSVSSSPTLELTMESERSVEFNRLFHTALQYMDKNVGIDVEDLRAEINQGCAADKLFSKLE
eukprot:CAMPEP_0194080182 /NCGR_PEP_ID=MMETSP0149-20130528/6243_1 /TAXON_ID=122233 /ORGANISM="Chaetoceros debilis, Strain MM31A-1" /LENGTH=367 /DNA_ID=CAMNT_0038761835 /DNA_START=206 /DNA_END=1306 /DNA_ORIENTATION=-